MKNNLGPVGKGLAYQIVPTTDLAKVEWLEEVNITADEAMSEKRGPARAIVAADWLVEKFREQREWDSKTLFDAARHAGISRSAMFEAKQTLCLPKARRNIQENGEIIWTWWVPDDWSKLSETEEEGIPL